MTRKELRFSGLMISARDSNFACTVLKDGATSVPKAASDTQVAIYAAMVTWMLFAAAAGTLMLACGSSSSHADASGQHGDAGVAGPLPDAGTLSASGTLNGENLPNMEAVLQLSTTNGMTSTSILKIHGFSGSASVCSELQNNNRMADTWAAAMQISFSCTGAPRPISAGSYSIGSKIVMATPQCSESVAASIGIYDTNCAIPTMFNATTGTITLSRVDASSASGTFDLTFKDGSLNGSFSSVPFCSAPFVEQSAPTCVH
jgi:hypothetical protein